MQTWIEFIYLWNVQVVVESAKNQILHMWKTEFHQNLWKLIVTMFVEIVEI